MIQCELSPVCACGQSEKVCRYCSENENANTRITHDFFTPTDTTFDDNFINCDELSMNEDAYDTTNTLGNHYRENNGIYEPIEIIEHYALGFNLGNAIKYILRAGRKEGETKENDLKKALTYLHREIYGEWPK